MILYFIKNIVYNILYAMHKNFKNITIFINIIYMLSALKMFYTIGSSINLENYSYLYLSNSQYDRVIEKAKTEQIKAFETGEEI